jgi:hypothetical protein
MPTNGLISLYLTNLCLGSIHLKRRTKSTRKERSRVLISGKASRVTFTETPLGTGQTKKTYYSAIFKPMRLKVH